MKNIEKYQKIFKEKIISLEKTDQGLTNDNYKISTISEIFFLRQPDTNIDDLFDRKLEKYINDLIVSLDIDIPYLYFDEKTGIKVTRYLEGLLQYDQCQLPNKDLLVSDALKKLHNLKMKCGTFFDVNKKIEQYKEKIINYQFDLKPFEFVLNFYNNYQGETTICHNDLVNGNLLFKETDIYLIDYEYSCDNYPIFDLTSFITENEISNPQQKEEFYKSYYGDLDQKLKLDILYFEMLHDYLWCHWAMMMYELKKEQIYYEIALGKYNNLNQRFKTI